MGVDLRMGTTATRLDLTRRLVRYRDETGADAQVAFDDSCWPPSAGGDIRLGTRPRRRPRRRVHRVKNLDEGAAWLNLLGRGGPDNRPGGPQGHRDRRRLHRRRDG